MKLTNANITALNEYFAGRQEAQVAFIRALVEAESPSGDEAGSKAVVSMLAAAAEEISGVTKVERVASEHYGEHLLLRAWTDSPDSPDSSRAKPILLLGHTDTVHPRGSLGQRPWRVEANRAYGPGVFDMKANCALTLEVIRACVETGIRPSRPVVVLLTCDEETGSLSGRQLVEAEAREAHAVLVLEPPAKGGRVKTGRKELACSRLKRVAGGACGA